MLHASPRGTWRACLACRRAVTPAAVLAPYERGQDGPGRQVVSQRERDMEAIGLARRKGVMLGQLAGLAGDDRLHPESVPVVEWFADQVKAAASDGRLDALAALLPESGIRRRRWWQGQPAALDPGDQDDDDQDDETYIMVDGRLVLAEWTSDGRLVPASSIRHAEATSRPAVTAPRALTAVPSPPSWAGALAALGWRLHLTPGGCQIITSDGGLCGDTENPYQITDRYGRAAWICWQHKEPLTMMMQQMRRLA